MEYYDAYFDAQTGGGGGLGRSGYGGISHVYIGSPNQRGHGIGSFLGGLFRRIIPLLKQGARTIGKEALRSGVNVANDILDKGMHPREAFQTRLRESGTNLKRKAEEKINNLMQGSGYKAAKINKLLHSLGSGGVRRIGVKKRKKSSTSRKRSGRIKKKKRKGKKKTVRRRETKTDSKKRKKRRKKPRTVSDIFA